MRRLALLSAMTLMFLGACRDGERPTACRPDSVPPSAAPHPKGFVAVADRLLEPEACGAGATRHLVYRPQAPTGGVIATFAAGVKAQGWSSTACVTPAERCFRHGHYFLAAFASVGGASPPPGYPARVAPGDQVLVVLEAQ